MGHGSSDKLERPFRVHERKPVRFVVGIVHPMAGWQAEARVHNMSLGGAGLEMPGTVLREDDRVVLSFIAPSLWDPLEIPARVAWARPATRLEPTRFGVAFEPTDAPKVLALFELIAAFVFDG